jgi:hypothetical protein
MSTRLPEATASETFDEVFKRELDYVARRRSACQLQAAPEGGTAPIREDLIGLAMSGGGIRSAIFSLGVLQALHRFGQFHRLDYTSTVSGGGYIATCLSVLMRQPGSTFPFVRNSSVLNSLRNRSQYLAPGGLWLRSGSIVLMGVAVNLVTLAPIIILAAIVIAVYGRLRLTSLLDLPAPAFDPLFLVGLLLLLVLIRSLLESILQIALWPLIMELEWADRVAVKLVPEVREAVVKRMRTLKTVVSFASPLAPIFGPFLFLSGLWRDLGNIVELWAEKDWKSLRQKSLRVRQNYRRALQGAVLGLLFFGFLELQPLILRFVHDPPVVTSAVPSIEFWTAVISLVAAIASILSVNGAGGRGASLARVAPYVGAVLGPLSLYLVCLLIAERLLFDIPRGFWTGESYAGIWNMVSSDFEVAAAIFVALVLIVAVYVFVPLIFFDLNERSIHAFYRDSLGETFVMGEAENGTIEPEGDLKLSELNQTGSPAPYHVYNATLNLQADPALRNTARYGDFFVFTRDVFGGERTGYAPTSQLERTYGSFTVASAMATSGAAASPHMGIFSRRAFVLIMSLLNIRLGCWLPHPQWRKDAWWRPNPFWLFREMFGFLDANHRGIYLSDGGHLENTGIYQLLKRRCRVIVAVDASTDPDMTFHSLADLKRYARVDLGVEIKIDVEPLRRPQGGLSQSHWISGVIEYPDASGGVEKTGKLFLVKSSLTGDEDVETQAYQSRAPLFPHEPLSDQFFDEGQFEAYSLLGYHAAASMLQSPTFSLERDESLIPAAAALNSGS